jgi:hypothetical protein
MFTTYTPPSGDDGICTPPAGTAKFYAVSLFNAEKKGFADNRFIVLDKGGIPPTPTALFSNDDSTTNSELKIIVGMELITDDDDNTPAALGIDPVLNKVFWKEE